MELDLSERRWQDALLHRFRHSRVLYGNLLHEEIPITRELLLLPEKIGFVQDGAPAQRAKATEAVVKWVVMKREPHKNPASSIDDLK